MEPRKRKSKRNLEPSAGPPRIDADSQRGSPECEEGRQAFRQGLTEEECPYPPREGDGARRTAWFLGYLDEQILRRHGRTLAAYGESWP